MAFITSIPLPSRASRAPQVVPARPRAMTSMNLLSHEKTDVVFDSGESELANYKLRIQVPGAFSKTRRRATLQEMKKKASFNGFRKGTIPPFIMKEVPAFVLRDCVDELLPKAIDQLDLATVEGKEAEMDIAQMVKQFEVGVDFEFDCDIILQAVKQDALDVDVEELPDVVKVSAEDKGPTADEAAAGLPKTNFEEKQ